MEKLNLKKGDNIKYTREYMYWKKAITFEKVVIIKEIKKGVFQALLTNWDTINFIK